MLSVTALASERLQQPLSLAAWLAPTLLASLAMSYDASEDGGEDGGASPVYDYSDNAAAEQGVEEKDAMVERVLSGCAVWGAFDRAVELRSEGARWPHEAHRSSTEPNEAPPNRTSTSEQGHRSSTTNSPTGTAAATTATTTPAKAAAAASSTPPHNLVQPATAAAAAVAGNSSATPAAATVAVAVAASQPSTPARSSWPISYSQSSSHYSNSGKKGAGKRKGTAQATFGSSNSGANGAGESGSRFAECPICSRSMPLFELDAHSRRCGLEDEGSAKKRKPEGTTAATSALAAMGSNGSAQKPKTSAAANRRAAEDVVTPLQNGNGTRFTQCFLCNEVS